MKIVQRPISPEMYNFLNAMQVANGDRVVNAGNVIDKTDTYISRMYTPNFKVSNVTGTFLKNLGIIAIIDNNVNLDEDSLTYWLLNSGLREKNYKMYSLFRSTIADIYCFTYAVDDNPYFLKYVNKDDITNTINNINYITDYLSGELDNSKIVVSLSETSALLGVIKNQLDVIKSGQLNDDKEDSTDGTI